MRRILFSLLISLVGIAASWFFLRPQEWSSDDSNNRSVIARVLVPKNTVLKQAEGRLLWAPLLEGDLVYLGDKIKTAGSSTVSLEFLDAKSRLDIEENSVLVMSLVDKKFALNMLEGRVFLKQEDVTEDKKVELLSGGEKLNTSGDVAVSISKDGKSEVENFNHNSQNEIFKELRPTYGEEVYLVDDQFIISWKNTTSLDTLILEHGESSSSLTTVPISVTENMSDLKIRLPSGTRYWKLVTQVGDKEIKSPLMKATLNKPLPPTPIAPTMGEVVVVKDRPVDVKWSMGKGNDSITFELATDKNFVDIVEKSEIKDQSFYTIKKNLQQGTYHWRLSAKVPQSEKMLLSNAHFFTVRHAETFMSPTPVSPAENTIYYIGKKESDIFKFEWKPQAKVRSYKLTIEGQDLKKEASATEPFASVKLNKVGLFTWFVTSQSLEGEESALPIKRKIEIRQLKQLNWLVTKKEFFYLENVPRVELQWELTDDPQYRLLVSKSADFNQAETYKVKGNDFPFRAKEDGFYYAKVYGIDEFGIESGESEIFEFKVSKAPPPPVPLISPEGPINASTSGDFGVVTENIASGLEVLASLYDKNGSIIDERRFTTKDIKFSDLLPGSYYLQARFNDDYGRKSEPSLRVEVVVPQTSKISAPKIKGIKVR